MENMDKIVEMCRQAVTDIIASVGGVGNLLQDENKTALVQSITNRMSQLGVDVEAVFGPEIAKAYSQGMDDADSFLEQQGKDAKVTGVNKQVHLAGVEAVINNGMEDMNASFRTALIMGIADIDAILESVNEDIAKGMILGDPSDYVARQVEQTFARNGMTAFITSDGKALPLDFYAQTVTRTKYRVSHTEGAINRYKENGVYHVKINEHHPTCDKCAKYQGMVVALDPDHAEGFPVAGVDVPLPPYHPNCQHTVRPFVMDYHSDNDIKNERRKWNQFDPDNDPRTEAQKNLYKAEQDIRRKARTEQKNYELMKATLPAEDVPKTIGAYRRMKRKNDESWKALQKKYKENAVDVIDAGPRDPGTPRKRKKSKKGSPGSSGAVKKTPKKQAKKPQKKQADKPDMSTMSNVNQISFSPDVDDQNAFARFDQAIDGIEFTNRRSTSKFLMQSTPNNPKVSLRMINANGQVEMARRNGKIMINEYVLRSKDHRPVEYQWKTMFHEFYHANLHGLDFPSQGIDDVWTRWEETATETSAFFMSRRAGIDTSKIAPSYSNLLVETLPVLKQLDEFKDCDNMHDFGAKFMKYRFDQDKATGDWIPLLDRLSDAGIPPRFNLDKYFKANYLDHVEQNKDRYVEMIFDSLQQDKTQSQMIKSMISKGLTKGIAEGKVNREVRMILPVAMNEIGVKIP